MLEVASLPYGREFELELFGVAGDGKIGMGNGKAAIAEEMDVVRGDHLKRGVAVFRVQGLADTEE